MNVAKHWHVAGRGICHLWLPCSICFTLTWLKHYLKLTGVTVCVSIAKNVMYFDDILFASLTATGLQNVINIANSYRPITNHGLCSNPAKTQCTVFGRNYLQPCPKWYLNNACLTQNSYVKYLGVHLSSVNRSLHATNHIKACRNCFHSMQGMCDRLQLRHHTCMLCVEHCNQISRDLWYSMY